MKRLFALACMALLCGCHGNGKETSDKATIYVATDMQYLDKSLYDNGEMFSKLLANNDGKLIERGEEILEAFEDIVLAEKPDVLLAPGDLTFNGEMVSLHRLKREFDRIQSQGVQVLVIPGNHDIAYAHACSYLGDELKHVQNIGQQDFKREMEEYGLRQALSLDEASFSYVYQVNETLWIMMLDANTEQAKGSLCDETLSWMEEQLKKARKEHVQVIGCSHQNVLVHNRMMMQGFVMGNHEKVAALLKKYGVSLHLSGHSHLQHTAIDGNLMDICTESMAVWPLRYGVLQVEGKEMRYEKKDLGIFGEEAYERFRQTVERGKASTFAQRDISPEVEEQMMEYAIQVNAAYYTGDEEGVASLKNDKRLGLWESQASDSFFYLYMQEIFRDR